MTRKPAPAKHQRKAATRRGTWKATFLKALEATGSVAAAARKAKVDRRTAYDHRHADEAFASAWDDALANCGDAAEEELYRRGVRGTRKPVYQSGMRVGYIQEYSDTALIAWLNANRSEKYRRNVKVEGEVQHRHHLLIMDKLKEDPQARQLARSLAERMGLDEANPN